MARWSVVVGCRREVIYRHRRIAEVAGNAEMAQLLLGDFHEQINESSVDMQKGGVYYTVIC